MINVLVEVADRGVLKSFVFFHSCFYDYVINLVIASDGVNQRTKARIGS